MSSDRQAGAHLEVALDTSRCQAYGLCLGIAPDVFDIPAGSAVAVLLRTTGSAEERATLDEAVRSCPAQAISVTVTAVR